MESMNSQVEQATKEALPVNFDTIPESLKQAHSWVVWKYEEVNGELKKPPFNARNGHRASHSDPLTWSSFEEAIAAYEGGNYAGVGYVLTGGLVGMDFDDCIIEGAIDGRVARIIQYLTSYAEISPSGRGVRILIQGSLPGPFKRRGKVEMYEDKRYVTITGHHISQSPLTISESQARLDAVYTQIFSARERSAPAGRQRTARPEGLRDIDTIIQKAMNARNGNTFKRYFEGDPSLWGNGAKHRSKSDADFTFCLLLVYWTNGDASQMDAIFRKSRLFDEKWDSARADGTYGSITIQKALELGRSS